MGESNQALNPSSTISASLPLNKTRWALGLLYALCLLVFVVTIPLPRKDGLLIGSDGVFYYAYLPSLILDRDLNFENEYSRLLPRDTVSQLGRTPTGLLPNPYSVGPALTWAPFFILAHAIALGLRLLGFTVSTDGTSYFYQALTLIGSISWGFAGVGLIFASCRRFFDDTTALIASTSMVIATNVIYYLIAEPSMSHNSSLFAVSLLIFLWLEFRSTMTPRRWVLLGLAGGLVALVRLPDATFLLLPILDSLSTIRADIRGVIRGWILFALFALVAFSPQMLVWQVLYGSPFVSGYLYTTEPTFYWLAPKMLEVLVSPLHGLYLWHPVLLLATIGWYALSKRDSRLTALLGIGFLLQVYVIGAWRDWGQGDSFGGRMFISSLPALALGLGAFVESTRVHHLSKSFGIVALALVAWNGLFFVQYRLGYIPMGAPLTLQQFTLGKLEMLADVIEKARGLIAR